MWRKKSPEREGTCKSTEAWRDPEYPPCPREPPKSGVYDIHLQKRPQKPRLLRRWEIIKNKLCHSKLCRLCSGDEKTVGGFRQWTEEIKDWEGGGSVTCYEAARACVTERKIVNIRHTDMGMTLEKRTLELQSPHLHMTTMMMFARGTEEPRWVSVLYFRSSRHSINNGSYTNLFIAITIVM